MAASRYSVGMGPVPVPPEVSRSSTTRSKPPAATRHRQPPSRRATTELVCGRVPGSVMPVVVTGGPGRQFGPPRPPVVGGDQARPAHQPFQRPQPALAVAPALAGRVSSLPVGDLADQRLTEVLPVDAPGVVQRQRDTERLALPRRGEDELAVVPRRGGRAGRVEQVGRASVTHWVTHGTATLATPTMASLLTRAASSASE